MLDTSPQNLYEEIRAAEALRDAHVEGMDAMLEQYVGPYFNDRGAREADSLPENHWHEYLSLVVPRVIFDNPRVRATTRTPEVDQNAFMARALAHALNRWVRDTKARNILRRMAVDMMFRWGVMLTTQEPRQGVNDLEGRPVSWPQWTRIPQRHYFVDPLAMGKSELRYQGHLSVRDKATLVDLAKQDPKTWNLEVVEGLSEGAGLDKLDRAENDEGLERNEVVARELWIPEYELEKSEWKRLGLKSAPTAEEGFHGAVFTLSVEQSGNGEDADFLRPPRPYYGHESGPYAVFGVYDVPGSLYPLSPLVAVQGLVEQLNDIARGISGSIDRYKRFVAADTEVAQKMKDIPHDNVMGIAGFDRARAEQYEIGGVTEQMLAGQNIYRDRLERNSGLNDAMRGNVSGEGTATENMIADEAASARMGFIKQVFSDTVSDCLEKAAWYLVMDDRFEIPLPEDEFGPGAKFAGGLEARPGAEVAVEDPDFLQNTEIEIEPYSMERTSEGLQQRRAKTMLDLLNLVPLMAQFPDGADYDAIISEVGDAVNMPDLGDRFFPEKAAANLQDAQAMLAKAGPSGGAQGGGGGRPVPGAQRSSRGPDTNPSLNGQVAAMAEVR